MILLLVTEGATNFKFHLAWHRALFLLDAGKTDEALEAYDRKVRDFSSPLLESQPDLYIDVQNAASLLMRLELLGVTTGGRWTELADKAERRIGEARTLLTEVTASRPVGTPLPRFYRSG